MPATRGRIYHSMDIKLQEILNSLVVGLEWREICQQNVGSFFSRNILSTLGDSLDVGSTH